MSESNGQEEDRGTTWTLDDLMEYAAYLENCIQRAICEVERAAAYDMYASRALAILKGER